MATDTDACDPSGMRASVRLWTLHRNGRTATCEAHAHALGLEVVASVAGEIERTEVARTPDKTQHVADQWQQRFNVKGWQR